MNNIHNQKRKKAEKLAKDKKNAETKKKAEADEKRKAQKAADDAVKKAAKTVKDAVELCDFPKIATDAKIQGAGYDSSTGSFVKLKDLSFSSGQLERLIAIAQDGKARVRVTIEEINPRFDSKSEKSPKEDPTFTDAPKTGKKKIKKTSKKKAADDGSKLPI